MFLGAVLHLIPRTTLALRTWLSKTIRAYSLLIDAHLAWSTATAVSINGTAVNGYRLRALEVSTNHPMHEIEVDRAISRVGEDTDFAAQIRVHYWKSSQIYISYYRFRHPGKYKTLLLPRVNIPLVGVWISEGWIDACVYLRKIWTRCRYRAFSYILWVPISHSLQCF